MLITVLLNHNWTNVSPLALLLQFDTVFSGCSDKGPFECLFRLDWYVPTGGCWAGNPSCAVLHQPSRVHRANVNPVTTQ